MSNASYAEKYARAGYPVFPVHWIREDGSCSCRVSTCSSPGKHPIIKSGLLAATDRPLTTMHRWRDHPLANIAIVPPAGLIVLDVDPRNGGDAELEKLVTRYGKLPDTLTARTGGGGEHYWFKFAGSHRASIGAGLDIKGHKGYLLAPPSNHVSGNHYRWLSTAQTAPAPAWLRGLVTPPARAVGTSTGPLTPARGEALIRVVAQAQEGERNGTLYWAAARAHEYGADEGFLDELVATATGIGLSESEARATVDSAAKAPARQLVVS